MERISALRRFYTAPTFWRWLHGLPPREELIARMALSDAVLDPGESQAWEARVAALQADLIKSDDDWNDLLKAVVRTRREIAGEGQL